MKLKTGDIILQDYHSKNKLFEWFLSKQDYYDYGIWNHVFIYYKDNIFLQTSFDGLKFFEIDLKWLNDNPDYTMLRHKEYIDEQYMQQIIDDYVGNHLDDYGEHSLINAALSVLIQYYFGKRIQIFKAKSSPHCSRLVAEIYTNYGLPFKINEHIITPNDIYRSDKLK